MKNGREVLVQRDLIPRSQLHTLYGGVVPEIASRKHIEKINPCDYAQHLRKRAKVTLEEMDAIAVDLRSGTGGRFAGRRGRSQGNQLCIR